jgi:diguanylate cyclase (GGDEF)-like protein
LSWITRELAPLFAVVAATLGADGTLLEANAGFLRIAGLSGEPTPHVRVPRVFVQPKFLDLATAPAGADGEVYHGLMTMGSNPTDSRTLRGRVWRVDETLRVLAEYDVAELEQLTSQMLNLNRDYAAAQFELAQTNLKLQQREAQIVALTLTDSLTGVGNHRRFDQDLTTEIKRFERTGEPLSALMADLDHFKAINDGFGHDAGDKVLAAFGELLRQQLRATEVATRIGGEEFVVLLPHTALAEAILIAERLRAATAELRIPGLQRYVTASFGVATMTPNEDRVAFMRRLDQALYQAKNAGRNCVVTC